MSSPHRASSTTSDQDNARKRVCKACDRCRLKKSKCDGASPCSRCKADNAICVFGERKKSHDKVYPKGYVEMLEQQQSQLVSGIRELYRRVQFGEGWVGQPLKTSHGGHPLTHDILERLDLLHASSDSPIKHEGFEDDLSVLQHRCSIENGSQTEQKRRSISPESEPALSPSGSSHGIHSPTQSPTYVDPFVQKRSPPTPPMDNNSYLGTLQFPQQSKSQQFNGLPTVSHTRGMNPMELLHGQLWQHQHLSMDQNMDVDNDMFSAPYRNNMTYDNPALYSQYSPQMTDTLSMNWADSLDFLDPNAMQQT